MTKEEFANAIYDWLKTDETMKFLKARAKWECDDNIILLVKIPYEKEPLPGVSAILCGEIHDMTDWRKTSNFSRMGFWLKDRQVFLEDDMYGYRLGEVNSHFVNKKDYVDDFIDATIKEIYDVYHKKYPTLESLGLPADSEKMEELRNQVVDTTWLNGTYPTSPWEYFKTHARSHMDFLYITDEMCIHALLNKSSLLAELYARPILNEEYKNHRQEVDAFKRTLADAYIYDDLYSHYKPSATVLATKDIVNKASAFIKTHGDKHIQRFKVTCRFSHGQVLTDFVLSDVFTNYEVVYHGIDTINSKFLDNGKKLIEYIPAENILKITYGKNVVYEKPQEVESEKG